MSRRGDSGSGKSSVNALLLRYYDPIHGRVTYDGQGEYHSPRDSYLAQRTSLRHPRVHPGVLEEYYWCCPSGKFILSANSVHVLTLFQDPILFTGTIASNIAYGNESATREEIEAAARQANCEFVWGMPKGFDTESEFSFVHLIES